MLGALLVMIGNTIVKAFKKTDHQHFVRHCVWGREYGETGPEKEWAVEPFDQWKGRYDRQLKSLQSICQFEIDERWSVVNLIPKGINLRTVNVTLGWLPIGSRIEATYVEQWNGAGTQNLHGSWDITGQDSGTDAYTIEAQNDNTLSIELKDGELKLTQLGTSPRADLYVPQDAWGPNLNKLNPDFQQLQVGIRLVLNLGNKEEITIPYEENNFKKGMVAKN